MVQKCSCSQRDTCDGCNTKYIEHKIMAKSRVLGQLIVNLVLLVLYFHFFGVKYLQKYLDREVIITVHEEYPEYITLPGKCIYLLDWMIHDS